MENGLFITYLVCAYILGSIPFSLILPVVFLGKDIREIGSKNVGATNVYRINKKLSLIVLLLDISKTAGVLFVAKYYSNLTSVELFLVGLFSILGHIYPIWIKFKGGKGVASVAGAMLALNPYMFCSFLGTWITTYSITRYPSLSSIIAIIASFVVCAVTEDMYATSIYFSIAAIIVYKHKDNIKRLINKKEKKV